MFYSKFMFVKKGPLSKVWIAAHFHRKLTKSVVQGTDINLSAKSISDPTTPLALRLSGQLLLGLVRIYQKKVKYLQEDCSDALTKMKMVLRPGAVDLPPESSVAPAAQITHADNYESLQYAIPDIPIDGSEALDDLHITEGMAASSAGALHLASISAEADDITMPDPGDELGLEGIDLLLGGGDYDPGFQDDFMVPFGDDSKVSDIEAGRATDRSAVAEDFDIDLPDDSHLSRGLDMDDMNLSKRSDMGQEDMSAFDTTTDGEHGYGDDLQSALDISTDAETVVIEEPAPKPRPVRKRKLLKRDETTELSSKFISESLKDRSDIVLSEGRVLLGSKRARTTTTAAAATTTTATALLRTPMGLASLSRGVLTFGVGEDRLLHPSLRNVLTRDGKLQKSEAVQEEEDEEEEEEEEEKKAGEEEEGLVLPEDDMLQADQQFDFDGGMDMSIMDDSTTAMSKSVAPTPAKAGAEEEEEAKHEMTYNDDLDHDRQELNDFFGESSQRNKKKAKASDDEGTETAAEEETGWSQRTKKMQQVLVREMKKKPSIGFDSLVEGRSRKLAAATFYQLLILKSHSVVEVEQDEPYSDITLSNLKSSVRAH